MFTTITTEERESQGVSQLPDSPQITSVELKRLFDSLGNLAIDKFVQHIDEISAETGAGNVGGIVPEGYNALPNLQSIIDAMVLILNDANEKKHTHANKDDLDAITSEVKGNYDALVAMFIGITSIANNLNDSTTTVPNSHAVYQGVRDAISNAGYLKPEDILERVYPVGTVYSTINSAFNPSSVFGGVWQLRGEESGITHFIRTA